MGKAQPTTKPMAADRLAEIRHYLLNHGLRHTVKFMAVELLAEVDRLRAK